MEIQYISKVTPLFRKHKTVAEWQEWIKDQLKKSRIKK